MRNVSAPDSNEGQIKEEGLAFCGLPDSGERGSQQDDLHSEYTNTSSQWGGLSASEVLNSAMLKTPTLLRANGQKMR